MVENFCRLLTIFRARRALRTPYNKKLNNFFVFLSGDLIFWENYQACISHVSKYLNYAFGTFLCTLSLILSKKALKGQGGLKDPPPPYRNFWYHFGKMVNLFFRKFEQWYVFATDLTMLSDILHY